MSLYSLLRRSSVFSPLVLLATVGAACGSSQPQSPLEVLQHSYERSKDITSFRAHMDMEITTPDGPVLMALKTETGRDGRVRTVIDMDAFGDKQSFEMIIAKPYIYVEVPDRGWTQVSAAAMAEFTGQSVEVFSDPTAFYSSLFPVEDVPWELYVVESLGHEEVEGIQTEHLSIQFDFREIWQRLDEEQRQQLFQASPDPDVGIEELVEEMDVTGVEVWIDDRGYSRRTVMEIVFSGEGLTSLGGGEMSMKMDMRMFDFDKEIAIKLPEGYEDFETETGPIAAQAPTSAYEELLALIPDNPNTRSLVFLNDYVLLRRALNVGLPEPDADQEALKSYFESLVTTLREIGVRGRGEAPFISGYSQYALSTLGMGQYLALDVRNVHHSAVAGSPPGKLGVMLGDFDPAATDAALKRCAASVPNCGPPLLESHEGITFYSWGADLEADLRSRLGPPAFDHLGRGGRIAVQDSHVFYTVETPGMEGLIEASLGQNPSLLDVKDLQLLAKAMSQLGAHASILSDQTLSVEDGISALLDDYATEEDVERIRRQLSAIPALETVPGLRYG